MGLGEGQAEADNGEDLRKKKWREKEAYDESTFLLSDQKKIGKENGTVTRICTDIRL